MRRRFYCGSFRPGTRGMVVGALLTLALGALLASPAARADDPDNCLFCHQYRGLSRYNHNDDRLFLFFVKPEYTEQKLGPHARIACTDCHRREEVAVVPHKPVTRVNCTQTCHLHDPGGLDRRFSHEGVAEMLDQSVHPRALLESVNFTGGPLLGPTQSACLYCHDEPIFRDPGGALRFFAGPGGRMFDRCEVCHAQQIPADIVYYLRHIASRLQTGRPSLEMAQVCAVCHSDPKVRAAFHMQDATASWVRSFHGKAALLGDQTTANCVSCHVATGSNAHLMLGPESPASAVNPAHVADSCRSTACHPGADKSLASVGVHLNLPTDVGTIEYLLAAAFIVLTVLTFGPSMLIVVFELFGLVIGREHHGAQEVQNLAARVWADPIGRRRLTRFTSSQRVQHWVLAILFTLLVLTGFPMKFADQGWARSMIETFGGLGRARTIHHWAGVALVAGFFGHLVYAMRVLFKRRRKAHLAGKPVGLIQSVFALPMMVSPADALKMVKLLLYHAGIAKHAPTFGRFTVKEKFEYIGVAWGTTLLGITGLMLWGAAIASHFIPGRIFNLALIAHTYEAFLAIIHVGILHIINVMLKPSVFPLSLATITGKTPILELADEHADQVREVAAELNIAPGVGGQHG